MILENNNIGIKFELSISSVHAIMNFGACSLNCLKLSYAFDRLLNSGVSSNQVNVIIRLSTLTVSYGQYRNSRVAVFCCVFEPVGVLLRVSRLIKYWFCSLLNRCCDSLSCMSFIWLTRRHLEHAEFKPTSSH